MARRKTGYERTTLDSLEAQNKKLERMIQYYVQHAEALMVAIKQIREDKDEIRKRIVAEKTK